MQNILVVQTAFLGDLLLGIPLFKNLKRLYPQAQIQLVCRKGLGTFFKDFHLVDNFYEIEKNHRQTYNEIKKQLAAQIFDLILCPHESFRTTLFVKPLKSPLKVSYKKFYQFLTYNELVERPMQYPEALRQLSLLTAVSEDIKGKFSRLDKNINYLSAAAPVPEWASMQIVPYTGKDSKVICLAPGSVWLTKMWPKDYYAEVAASIIKNGYQLKLIGSSQEKEICDWIQERVPQVSNEAGKTNLSDLVKLFSQSKLLLCNDSGPMHMASAAGLPTLAIFGPTVQSFGYRPWQNHAMVEDITLDCRPCGKHGHKECPIGTHACMRNIQPAQITKSLEKLL
jgi:heptosyltransferase II